MFERISTFFMAIPVWVYVILLVLFAVLAVLCALRTVNANTKRKLRTPGYTSRTVTWRAIQAVLCVIIAVLAIVGAVNVSNMQRELPVDPPSQGDDDPPEEPPVEPVPDVNLTRDQLSAFLSAYSLEFDGSSLTYGVGWKSGEPTMVQQRIAAIKAAGGNFEDGLAFPYQEALDRLETFKTLSDEEKEAFFAQYRHDIYQDIVANPVIGMAWLEMLAEEDLILVNNDYWILPNLEVLQQMFAGTYEQPQPDDPGYEELMKIELNNIPNSGDVTARGLDLLLVYNGPRLEVRQSWARLAARICGVLDFFDVKGFTTRTSSMNFCLLPTAEDSMVRATKATYQESQTAILLVYSGKDGKEAIAYGSNVFDRRPEQFPVNVKEPTKTPPTNSDPKPETPPTTTPPPVTPPPTTTPEYGVLTIRYIDDSGNPVPGLTNHVETLQVGASYNVKSPIAPAGYALKDQSQSVVRSSRYGTMVKTGRTIDVVYVAQNFTVTINYVYENGTKLYPSETYPVKVGTWYSFDAKTCPRYYWVEPENYSGTMPARDVTLTFIYHYLYLQEWKDPDDGSAAQGNAPEGGGSNLPGDGTGIIQPTEPPRTDYPGQGTAGDPSTNGGRTDLDPDGNSTTPLTPDKPGDGTGHESTGQGGNHVDHPIVDAHGGSTDNGTPPDKDPIPVDPGTTITTPGGDVVSPPGDGGVITTPIGEPD